MSGLINVVENAKMLASAVYRVPMHELADNDPRVVAFVGPKIGGDVQCAPAVNGKPVYMLMHVGQDGVAYDVTTLVQHVCSAARSRDRFALNTAFRWCWALDGEHTLRAVADAACEVLNARQGQALRKAWGLE